MNGFWLNSILSKELLREKDIEKIKREMHKGNNFSIIQNDRKRDYKELFIDN